MKRLLIAIVLIVVAIAAFADEVPIPFSGSVYLVSRSGVKYDDTLSTGYDFTEFQYPGRIALQEGGNCMFQYTNGMVFYYTWERHPEMENVIVLTTESGTSHLVFAPIAENDVVDAQWSMVMVNLYRTWVDVRTYVVRQ